MDFTTVDDLQQYLQQGDSAEEEGPRKKKYVRRDGLFKAARAVSLVTLHKNRGAINTSEFKTQIGMFEDLYRICSKFLDALMSYRNLVADISQGYGAWLIDQHNLENRNLVLTYLRIRGRQGAESNDRFQLQPRKSGIRQANSSTDIFDYLEVQYRNDNFPYYTKDNKVLPITDPSAKHTTLAAFKCDLQKDARMQADPTQSDTIRKNDHGDVFQLSGSADNAQLRINKYCFKFLFGPFTNVFGGIHDASNRSIADGCLDMLESLRAGTDIFVVGYGVSGAGKTSSLIYLKNGSHTEEGIM